MPELQSGSFEALVRRPDTHAVLDLAGEGTSLLILFGGIAGGVSMPVFEFFRMTSSMPGKKAFLRDPLRGWYQLGVPGIGDSALAVREFLDEVIAQARVDRVVMAGASAGGFAALLFGAWCGAHEVLAFSPQTFIDPQNRREHGDDRWAEQIEALHAAMGERATVLDLAKVWPDRSTPTRFQVHVGADDALDMAHARRITACPGVELVTHEQGGHRLVKTLRDRGILQPLLLQALSGGGPPR